MTTTAAHKSKEAVEEMDYSFPQSKAARLERLKLNPKKIADKVLKQSAIKRLMHDWREVQENPLETVSASPLENNLFEWHANLIGPTGTDYERVCFHLILEFPHDYPLNPPEVYLKTSLKHSHVYGSWICLDLLRSWRGFSKKKNTGWSTGYTIQSILLQLQAFLLEPEEGVNGWDIKFAVTKACNFKCPSCPHDMKIDAPWPVHSKMVAPFTWREAEDKFCFESVDNIMSQHEKEAGARKSAMNARIFAALEKRRAKEEEDKKKMERKLEIRLQQFEKSKAKEEKSATAKEDYETRYIPGFGVANKLQTAKDKKKKQKKLKQQQEAEAAIIAEQEQKKVIETPVTKAPPRQRFTLTKADRYLESIWNTTADPYAQTKVNLKEKASESDKFELTSFAQSSPFLNADANWAHLAAELLENIFSYMQQKELKASEQVCHEWRSIAELYSYVWDRKYLLQCFHLKSTWEEDVLGVGVRLEFYPKSNKLSYVYTPMDIISYKSFYQLGVRKGVWHDSFTHFVPIYVNPQHATKALKVLVGSLHEIYDADFISCEMAIDLFCKLMNTMVVDLMNGEKHASIKALQGYCFFHRMLIALVQLNPKMLQIINERVRSFLVDPEKRIKRAIPSLGDFLPLLSVSDYSWQQVAGPVLSEVFDRNVLWITKQHQKLAMVERNYVPEIEQDREKKSFEAVSVSLKLIMFHVYFLSNALRYDPNSDVDKLTQMAQDYDSRYGLPTYDQQEGLQSAIFEIQNAKDYREFFKRVQLPVPSDYMLHKLLRSSVFNSQNKRYHRKFFNATEDRKRKLAQAQQEHMKGKGIVKKKESRKALNTEEDDY